MNVILFGFWFLESLFHDNGNQNEQLNVVKASQGGSGTMGASRCEGCQEAVLVSIPPMGAKGSNKFNFTR